MSCGTCPSGYTCGSANGIAVCRAASGVPLFSNVTVIVMENTSYSTLHDDSPKNSPYLHGLWMSAAYSTNYHGITHPSLPNYIALASGQPGVQSDGSDVACDCAPAGSSCTSLLCNRFSISPTCGCEQTTQHIGDQLEAAHLTWKAYAESMGTACNLTAAGDYVPRHVPFLYFKNVQEDMSQRCSAHVVDYTNLANDLKSAPSTFTFIAPNLTDDMHGTSILTSHTTEMAAGDKWLMDNVPAITGTDAYKRGGLLVIVWDEDDNSGIPTADAPIPIFVLSPLAKSGGFSSGTQANHYSLLATFEDGLNLPRLANAAKAQPLSDFFPDH
jgi:hypothetical protein